MNTVLRDEVAATSTQYFDAVLAISAIYLSGVDQLSELALVTARETLDDCVRASTAAVDAAIGENTGALQLPQPILPRILATSAECYQIVLRSHQDAAKVLGTRFSVPFLQMRMPADINTAMEMFSRGMETFSKFNAVGIAAATDAASGLGEDSAVRSRKVA